MAALKLLELSMLLNLLSSTGNLGGSWSGKHNGQKFMRANPRFGCLLLSFSTSPILDISLVEATRTGFHQLFEYIQGKNEYKKKIDMTGPVITQVFPSDAPFCESSFIVSFYEPKENQADTPPVEGLHVKRWNPTNVAVRQFGGFVSDAQVGE